MEESDIREFVKKTRYYKDGERFGIGEIRGRFISEGYEVSRDRLNEILRNMIFDGELSPCDKGTGYKAPSRSRYWLTKSWRGEDNAVEA